MNPDAVPESVISFVRGRIRSVTQLEILLLLHAEPARLWTADDLNDRLSSSETSVRLHLDRLIALGLVVESRSGSQPEYRINTSDAATVGCVGQLADAYHRWRFRIIDAIFDVGGDSLRRFSDSFRIRQEDENV